MSMVRAHVGPQIVPIELTVRSAFRSFLRHRFRLGISRAPMLLHIIMRYNTFLYAITYRCVLFPTLNALYRI